MTHEEALQKFMVLHPEILDDDIPDLFDREVYETENGEFLFKRECYECQKPIENIEGNYWCDDECKAKWQEKNYGGQSRLRRADQEVSSEELKARILEMAREKKEDPEFSVKNFNQ